MIDKTNNDINEYNNLNPNIENNNENSTKINLINPLLQRPHRIE
jgi:hypothetical protein